MLNNNLQGLSTPPAESVTRRLVAGVRSYAFQGLSKSPLNGCGSAGTYSEHEAILRGIGGVVTLLGYRSLYEKLPNKLIQSRSERATSTSR